MARVALAVAFFKAVEVGEEGSVEEFCVEEGVNGWRGLPVVRLAPLQRPQRLLDSGLLFEQATA